MLLFNIEGMIQVHSLANLQYHLNRHNLINQNLKSRKKREDFGGVGCIILLIGVIEVIAVLSRDPVLSPRSCHLSFVPQGFQKKKRSPRSRPPVSQDKRVALNL